MAKLNITVNDVLKKDLRLLGFLVLNGVVAFATQKLNADPVLSLIFGGGANYLAYRVMEELKNEGYARALK